MMPIKYSKVCQTNNSKIASLKVKRTSWLFFGLCCYLLSQAYTIPILPVGPSWAIWPCLSDLAIGLIVLSFVFCHQYSLPASKANREIFILLIIVFLGAILSYVYYLNFLLDWDSNGVKIGIFQLYRLVEYIVLFWITTKIPLTPERIQIMGRIVDIVLIFVCIGIFLTYARIIPLSAVTAHLPQVGAWIFYQGYERTGAGKGLGFVGYNHAYTAAQVTLLLSLRMHLSLSHKNTLVNNLFAVLALIASFLSESRSGFGAILVYVMIYWSYDLKYVFKLSYITLFIFSITSVIGLQASLLESEDNSVLERQKTLFEAGNTDNLSGRDEIWMQRVDFLHEKPLRWIFGTGFGAAADSGDNAHMLPLHIILETGVLGLFMFTLLFSNILQCLYKNESETKPIFWVTISLLIGSISQETFYPVAALGHFLGFYLCSVAIVLRNEILL